MIDIIIKSWNAFEYTKLSIELLKASLKVPHQIVVIDDHSSLETIHNLESINGIRLVQHPANLGPAAVAITGFSQTSSPIVVLMDNDVAVGSDWLDKTLPYFNDPAVAVVSPMKTSDKQLYPESEISTRFKWEDTERQMKSDGPGKMLATFLNNQTIDQFQDKLIAWNKPADQVLICPPAFTSSCFLVMKRNLIEKVGGIAHKDFQGYGGEDVDLCWRVGDAGFKIIKTAHVYVHHFEHSSMEANNINVRTSLAHNNKMLYNIWGKKILALAQELRKEYTDEQIDASFPFVRIMENIYKYGNTGTF